MVCVEPDNCEDFIDARDGLDACYWNVDDNFGFDNNQEEY